MLLSYCLGLSSLSVSFNKLVLVKLDSVFCCNIWVADAQQESARRQRGELNAIVLQTESEANLSMLASRGYKSQIVSDFKGHSAHLWGTKTHFSLVAHCLIL